MTELLPPMARIDLLCEQEELYTKQEIVSAIRKIVSEVTGFAQGVKVPDYEFPYQQTFEAIAAATEIYPSKEQALGLSISVKKFQEAFNSHRDKRPLTEALTHSSTNQGCEGGK